MQTDERHLRPFLILWGGQAISLLGSQVVQFAIIWWLTERTGSATVLAAASFVGLLPQVVLGPLIGVWVDRLNRRLILFAVDTLIALATVGLLLLFWLELVAIWHIFVLLFVRAIGGAFHWPTMQASTTLMVPEKHLTRIQGMNQMIEGGLNIVAAPLGALVVTMLPMAGVLSIDVITALFAIVPLFFIAIPQPPAKNVQDGVLRPSFWSDFREGVAYLWNWPGLLFLLAMAMFINLMMVPAVSLLPLLVSDHFGRGAYFLSAMNVTIGVGVIVGGVLLTAWGGFKKRIVTSLIGVIGIGVGMGGIGFLPGTVPLFWVIAATAVVGFSMPIANGPLRAIMQATVAPEMQGRIFSIIGSGSQAMAPIGLILAGPLADLFGVPFWFVVAGVGTIGIGLLGFMLPAVMGIEDGRSPAHTQPKTVEVEHPISEPLSEG